MNDNNQFCTNPRFIYDDVRTALNVLDGKWKAAILWHLNSSPLRFNELLRILPNIRHKVLTQQLRELEKDNIISRTVFDEIPQRVEYSFTNYGKSLCPVFEALESWGKKHRHHMDI